MTYTDRPSVRPHHRENHTLTLSRKFGSPGENWLHIMQCCHKLTAVQTRYPLTSITWPYRGLRCRPIEVEYFYVAIRWQVTIFQMIAGSSLFNIYFKIHMKYVFLSLWPPLLKVWFQTDLESENSASYLKMQAGKTFSYHGHALGTLYVQLLCSDWSKFDSWVHTENLCNILKLVYFVS